MLHKNMVKDTCSIKKNINVFSGICCGFKNLSIVFEPIS